MPMVTNALTIGETRSGPSGPVSPVKTPITNEPITFTAKVPQGNVLCAVLRDPIGDAKS